MFRIKPIPLRLASALLLATFLCSISASAADQPAWLEIHSAHFTVITDAGEKRGREVALRFEQMRAVFGSLLGKDKLNLPRPLTILALKSDKMFYQVAPLRGGKTQEVPIDVPGFFLPGEDQNFIVLNLFEEESWRAVAHDFAHMLLNDNYPPAQGWFDEGLAEYFGSIRVDNKQVEIGGDPELRASVSEDLLLNQRETHPSQSLTELLGAQVWLSLPDLFTMKHDTSSSTEGTHHTLYYAESWIVMHYLLHEKKLAETGNYFDLVLNQRLPVEEAIHKAYGMSPDQLEQAVKDYFHSLTPLANALDEACQTTPQRSQPASSAQVYQFLVSIGPDDMAIIAKPLPDADARALYAGIQARVPERRELGLQALQALATATLGPASGGKKAEKKIEKPFNSSESDEDQTLATATGNEVAHRALAWDHIEHGEFDEAFAELSDAAILNPRDMWIRYYLSVLKYRSAQARRGDIQGLANMMQDLKNVLDWYPELADAYDLLAMARMEGGGPEAAMQSERAAIGLSPRNQIYLYHFAQIYIADKKWEAAQNLLERLKASGNPQVAAAAREKLDQIANQRKYGFAVASSPESPKLAPQKSPFDVLDEDAAKRAAQEQAAQSGGPVDRRPTRFVKGRLVQVDCSQSPAAVVTVAGDGEVLKLRTADYKSLLLIGADEFSCAWTDRRVTANYKLGGRSDGDLVSLELR
jgi:tetratricopeptide (TPR) repeat protein